MKLLSVVGLLFVAAIFATVPISAQVTPRGVELRVDQAQAITYGRYRRVARREYRRSYRFARRAYRRGYAAAGYGLAATAYASANVGYGAGYGYGGYGYRQVVVGPGRSCTIYPSGFRWCWTQF
jgi:hypothetical protein